MVPRGSFVKIIDAQARFVFAQDSADHPDAIPYDMLNVEFSHHGDISVRDAAQTLYDYRSGTATDCRMIHDADLEDGKYQRAECMGLDLLFKGWARLELDHSGNP